MIIKFQSTETSSEATNLPRAASDLQIPILKILHRQNKKENYKQTQITAIKIINTDTS